ncbi:hypothetical protein Bca4012_058736 [Brassica carinata]
MEPVLKEQNDAVSDRRTMAGLFDLPILTFFLFLHRRLLRALLTRRLQNPYGGDTSPAFLESTQCQERRIAHGSQHVLDEKSLLLPGSISVHRLDACLSGEGFIELSQDLSSQWLIKFEEMESDAPGIYNENTGSHEKLHSLNTIISVEMCRVSQKYIDLHIAIPGLLQQESTGAYKKTNSLALRNSKVLKSGDILNLISSSRFGYCYDRKVLSLCKFKAIVDFGYLASFSGLCHGGSLSSLWLLIDLTADVIGKYKYSVAGLLSKVCSLVYAIRIWWLLGHICTGNKLKTGENLSRMLDTQIEETVLFMLEQQGLLAGRLATLRERMMLYLRIQTYQNCSPATIIQRCWTRSSTASDSLTTTVFDVQASQLHDKLTAVGVEPAVTPKSKVVTIF